MGMNAKPQRYCYLCNRSGEGMTNNFYVCRECKRSEKRHPEIYHAISKVMGDSYGLAARAKYERRTAMSPLPMEIVQACPWLANHPMNRLRYLAVDDDL